MKNGRVELDCGHKVSTNPMGTTSKIIAESLAPKMSVQESKS